MKPPGDFPGDAFEAARANDALWLENHGTDADACGSWVRVGATADPVPFALLEVALYVSDLNGAVKSGPDLDAMDATALWLLRRAHEVEGTDALTRGLFSDSQSPMARCCAMLCLRSAMFLMDHGQSCFRLPADPLLLGQPEMWPIGHLLGSTPVNLDRARTLRGLLEVAHGAQVARGVLDEIQGIESPPLVKGNPAVFK